MAGPKHVIYQYNGIINTDQIEFDRDGKLTFTKGDFISKHGKSWRVDSLQEEIWPGDASKIPILLVSLVSVSVN